MVFDTEFHFVLTLLKTTYAFIFNKLSNIFYFSLSPLFDQSRINLYCMLDHKHTTGVAKERLTFLKIKYELFAQSQESRLGSG